MVFKCLACSEKREAHWEGRHRVGALVWFGFLAPAASMLWFGSWALLDSGKQYILFPMPVVSWVSPRNHLLNSTIVSQLSEDRSEKQISELLGTEPSERMEKRVFGGDFLSHWVLSNLSTPTSFKPEKLSHSSSLKSGSAGTDFSQHARPRCSQTF